MFTKVPLEQTTPLMHSIMCINREFKQITMAGAATAFVVEEIWGEYVIVARKNSTLSSTKYKVTTVEMF